MRILPIFHGPYAADGSDLHVQEDEEVIDGKLKGEVWPKIGLGFRGIIEDYDCPVEDLIKERPDA